ncbi:endonuclease/exonuclease/phosphatase family protein [Micromonospora sp. PSH03]|uniref:endonuclease/exonuclease/phosphatase family protein n=1 Tax=Micromonospora TaxID=1873 RepID=UPI001B35EF35|nr:MULTISPECIES: endonuclease/exonuclease/phosphatase family protein [Micromonospora]MBQ0990951.1 endonuclease/exonuclease/phosphatase family protein [Micromonospora sp. H61]MCG5458684.1 endonuclease/exonuclease/phosphatase family protein [Micromonospora salmantinae]
MTTDDEPAGLRVLTLNLLAPEFADWERRRAVLKPGLARLRPDVVALQETVWGNGYDQATDLLGPNHHVIRHSGRSADGVGAALVSRWPVGTVRELDLHVTERVDIPWSAVVVAEIEVPPPVGTVLVAHHKPTYQFGYAHERELQAARSATFVETLLAGRDLPVVLVGDFDDDVDSASVRFWRGKQSLHGCSVAYQDAWPTVHPDDPGHTFTPHNPLVRAGTMPLETGRRIDYVMVRCGPHGPNLAVAYCQRVFDEPVDGVWASDHFGVLADLRLPDHPPGRWR